MTSTERHKRWRQANPETWHATQKRAREKHPEYKALRDAWVAENRAHVNELARKRRQANTAKAHAKDDRDNLGRLPRLYGISPEKYWEMNRQQAGLCAICRKPCRTGKRLAVDHCHKTDVVRGLLCSGCNLALGAMQDDPHVLRAAAEYLERSQNQWHTHIA